MMPMRKRPAAVAAQDSRVKRLAARAGKGSLQDRRVHPRTLRLYREHAAALFRWCRAQGYAIPETCVEFDHILSIYAEDLYESGDSRRALAYTLSAVSFFVPSVSKRIPGAWRLHSIWGKCEPPQRTPPLTKGMVQAIAGHFVGEDLPEAATCVLLGYHCLLRTGEMLKLEAQDLSCSDSTVHLLLRETKVGQRLGESELVSVDDPLLIVLCRILAEGMATGSLLLCCSPERFRTMWRRALSSLRYPERFKPYGLRRGGATAHFQHHGSFSRTSTRGRWRHERTTRLYVQEALLDLSVHFDTLAQSVISAQRIALLEPALRRKYGRLASSLAAVREGGCSAGTELGGGVLRLPLRER